MDPVAIIITSTESQTVASNETWHHFDDIKIDSNFYLLLTSLVSAMTWIIYITYYNSRVMGYFVTKLLNRLFIREGFLHVGSITWNVLSGKIMCRDMIYITHDYTVRIQDGWLIFRWWRSYVPKDVSEDLSHSDTRLSIMLNGFELHVYNRCAVYSNLEKVFGLDPQMFPSEDENEKKKDESPAVSPQVAALSHTWRDLIPVIKLDVESGRVVFGNRLIPTTLSITVEEAHFVYSTKPAASRLDHFMHFAKCKAENFKVILAPSPKYTGMLDEAPRYMGEGFVVLSSNNVELYYYMDEAGVVPEQPEMLRLANGDIVESAPPIWGMDIKCGKGTDFSYGPWADRQRERLFKFFFPADCQPLKVTKAPQPGEKRLAQCFDIRLSTLNEATIDILFSKNKETNAVHINVGPGSYLEVTLPWVVLPDGFTTKVTGQLLHLEATTSLQYRSLVESETLEFNVKCHYPIRWNDHQEWVFNLTGCKATVHLIFAHKWFFQDLLNDWSSKARPDLLHFVPYTWKFTLLLKEFEIIISCNEYNWIDCSSQNQENVNVAFSGDLFDLSFDLPFCDFLPITIPIRFWLQGESVDLLLYMPEVCTSRSVLLALDANAKILGRDGHPKRKTEARHWRNLCQKSEGWIECWSVQIIALCINYTYHPCPPLGPPPQADITTPEKEEILLSPIRIPHCRKSPGIPWTQADGSKFEPSSLPPDRVSLELEMGPSVLLLYGTLIRNFLHLKENIFGDDQMFTDMQQSRRPTTGDPDLPKSDVEQDESAKKELDLREFRPLAVNVSITMHDVQAHLVKNCTENDPPCPMILLERFGFEMKKEYRETQLQLLLSPAILLISDQVARGNKEKHLTQGHLLLSGLQIRDHAMFSNLGRALGEDTLEYGWLLEVHLGKLSGKLTAPQLHHLVTSLETFLLLAFDDENKLRSPGIQKLCHHDLPPLTCSESNPDTGYRCPSPNDIKYRMNRVLVDTVDLYFLENSTALQLWASPIRVATCNLHGHQVKSGVTGVLPAIRLRQFVSSGSHYNTVGSGRSHRSSGDGSDLWLEVGSITLGPLVIEAAISLPTPEHNLHLVQQKYLRTHDEVTKRLWFLWPGETSTGNGRTCGCIGGCAFFGTNRNGAKFFKPSRQDLQEGINMASFRIHEPGRDPGFGQSILHEGQLVFHTPPYTGSLDVSLQPDPISSWDNAVQRNSSLKVSGESPYPGDRSKNSSSRISTASPSPGSAEKRNIGRRFSYTSIGNRSGTVRDVPYSRLTDQSPTAILAAKIDSDSKLNTERSKSILSVPETDQAPKCSLSDSKLAVDYFQSPIAESHHSLSSPEEQRLREVQRTTSMSSENQSETFYSADEDIIASRTSSLRNSVTLTKQDSMAIANRKKFSSELSIVPGKPISGSTNSAPDSKVRLSSHRSDHEIHTPEHRNPHGHSPNASESRHIPRYQLDLHDSLSGLQDVIVDSSDTHSISSTSFISAVSSQEDVTLVNLHMQVNKPIVDSPILMSSYVNHLSQVSCLNWSQCSLPANDGFTVPLFHRSDDGRLIYIGGRYTPRFDTLTEGFTSLKMVDRSHSSPPPGSGKTPTNPFAWDSSQFGGGDQEIDANCDEELLALQTESGTRTTIVVKMHGNIDIMVCPLVLESLQRFIDAVTPTLASLHPLTVLNHLHFGCISQVEAANVLKRDQSLSYLSQFQANSKRSTAERISSVTQATQLQSGNIYQESISTQVQGTIMLAKVNITLLQASVVEEVISFSALDNIRDLTCVSLFAVCLDGITARFHRAKQAKEVVETFHRPAVLPSGQKKSSGGKLKPFLGFQSASTADTIGGEPVYIETSEKQQEETVVAINVNKIHAQLRRLRNESTILKDAIITAIPTHHSKVLFDCARVTSPLRGVDVYMQAPTETPTRKNSGGDDATNNKEDNLGFIMVEIGLEGVSVKIVKRSQFEKGDNDNVDELLPPQEVERNYDSVKSKDDIEQSSNSPNITEQPTTSKPVKQPSESAPAAEPTEPTGALAKTKDSTNTSSCVIELKTVWFNFAAPPRAPITRKIDFTRLDWNLLSTASPAINAWMNPSNRFAIRVVHMFRSMYRRSTAIVACLMADALDVQTIHMPIKSRYGRYTPLAKTLQEDPSCQLCNVLQKYVLQTELKLIEENLRDTIDLPLLTTLRQGVIVLSRQWKNILYTPLLLDHNYKTKRVKPLNITFAARETDEENVLTDGENSGDDCEITDECAMLINTPAGQVHKVLKAQEKQGPPGIIVGGVDSLFASPSPPHVAHAHHLLTGHKRRHLPPTQHPTSSRASIVFPLIKQDQGYGVLKEDRTLPHLCSNPSLYSQGSQHSIISMEQTLSPGCNVRSKSSPAEDLYSWMAKQQDFIRTEHHTNSNNWEAKLNTLTTEDTSDDADYLLMPAGGYSLYPMHDSLRLLDAHLIFEPLLSCLGVVPRQMMSNLVGPGNSNTASTFDTWGSNLSLVGGIDTMRIDIVVSEFGKTPDKKKGKSSSKSRNQNGKFYLEIPPETPAFLCEKMVVELDLKKIADMTVDDLIHKQKVLYVSRGQLKKHTSTTLNIGLNVRYISQQVNMPLLRLLHQISNMYQNVKETQMELREQQPEVKLDQVKSNKNGSSSASDLQEGISMDKPKVPESVVSDEFPLSSSQQKVTSPSSSLRARPQSFAQKLRSTSKSVKGYMNLSDGITTPNFVPGVSPTNSNLDHITITSDREVSATPRPRCWKTVYYLLDLYATMPETKTITHRFSVAADIPEAYKPRKVDPQEVKSSKEDVENAGQASTPVLPDRPSQLNVVSGERTRLIMFCVARIHRTRLLATLSGLKLEAEITSLHSSLTCRKKSRPASLECSLTGQVGRTMIVLLEGVAPNQQTVVKVTVSKSQALYSSISRRSKDKNSGLLTVGAVNIDIPQHPVALHGMMTRGSKQLSSTLQELRVTRTATRLSRTAQEESEFPAQSPRHYPSHRAGNIPRSQTDSNLLQPLVMQFSIVLQSLSVTAALLPSLQAQYKMDQVNSTGVTGGKAKFTIDLPRHSLSFTTKLLVTEANLPSEASIELPKVHVGAEYVQDGNKPIEALFVDGVVLRQGSYLSAVADIGVFEHSLTTDLLNHLVFVQKVFMREVNEVVQKVYGGEKPVALWEEDNEPSSLNRVLFSLIIRVKRIQLTATTPTSSAVRLETGAVEFQLSNRVQNVSGAAQPNPYMKIFGKAQVDVNLSLGQLIKNVMFEEAEPEFQQFAFFKTSIGLRNAFQEEMVQGEDKEVVLITLRRPLIYIQPMAVDKAILVWLNYKNAYEYWNEQRSSLNKEVLTATQQVFEKVPFGQITSQLGTPHLGTLFLQLTVEDMGICLPLNPLPLAASWHMGRPVYDAESRNAVVITLENTSISACSSGSLVSKGRFVGLCLRFADDFETSLDDWKPDMSDGMMNMNLCVVSDGTYEVCSRTIAQKQGLENAKWFLNVAWQMEGVDIHLDINVGKQLSALGHTLTMLTGSLEEEENAAASYDSDDNDLVDGNNESQESIATRHSRNFVDSLPAFVLDPTLDAKKRSKLIEKEMNEQAKIINDLRSLGASHGTIEQEMKRLHELEALVFKDFRRDMIQKLRRQSVKASSIKGKFGLGSKSSSYRSRSFIVPSPTPEHHLEMESSPDDIAGTSLNSNGTSASIESSPQSGPSRTASLRVRNLAGPRVTFSDTHNICRQSSLPSGSELSLPEGDIEWSEDHMDIDGEKVELRRKSPTYAKLGYESVDTSPRDSIPSAFQKPQEPNIDFELDVKVLVNRGKCVLHTKDPAKEDELKLTSRMKKERSCSGGMFDFPPSSPNLGRRHKTDTKTPASTTRLRYLQGSTVGQLVDLTIFHIPGLDVKVHYESKTLQDEQEQIIGKKSGTKKASLFAWMTLQSIPEETIISPHILEFLEQTLEPIPAPQSKASGPVNTMFTMEQDNSWTSSATATGNYVYASFPVDVIVYFHMQPSTFRFSCLPVSRVECMLQLPSLDIIFSSKRAEEELHNEFDGKSSRFEMSGGSAVGGLSVTGCLADFSVYIFHPYGGGKKSGHKEAQWSPLADSERKDSLSVNVEFVKFHLSRSRKLNFPPEQPSKKASELSQAVIRFSTLVDIGSASFKYDMRRLTEILAFPKAWYRRSIVRRLFLGDLSFSAAYSDAGDKSPSSMEEELISKSSSHDSHPLSRPVAATARSPMLTTRERLRLSLDTDLSRNKQTTPEAKSGSAWETLVLFAVNFTKLNLHMNMGNVMGNVVWMTKDFRSDGRLSIGSTGHKNMYVGIGLGGSSLDAKGGIVGGTIELSKIDTYIHIREDPGTEPDHTVGLKLFALELRLDYMGTGVLMARVSSLAVSLRDEWKIHRSHRQSDIPTRRPAMIFMHGDLGWDQLQLMISKSTTADLLKMFYKLEEFFSQQFKSSKRVFSSLQPRGSSFRKRQEAKKKTSDSSVWQGATLQDARHHRHWQHVLYQVAGLHLATLCFPLPLSGTVLGGTMELHGNNISLACFHGINFKSKSWALFSLKEPCISFATEAQEVPTSDKDDQLSVHVVQTLTFSLGMMVAQPHAQHLSMATVCRLSRNELFPPQFRSLQEWFHYAFANSEIDAVDRFPGVEREMTATTSTDQRARKFQDPNHTREVIFALPSLQLNLKTEHLQAPRTPDATMGHKPMVECSFITEFEDHIFVTVDAEAFFFLHDLITSYVKEKERVSSSSLLRAQSPDHDRRAQTPSIDDERKRKAFDPAEMFTKDWRNYHCKTWHLEPTVRLLSWAGKSIEPYGIDYILQKLGFSHASTTIPKWMQRGFMDPLDKVLAVLMLRIVAAEKEEPRDHDSK